MALSTVSCGRLAGVGTDAGAKSDGGTAATTDGGPAADASSTLDASTTPDASSSPDASSTPDASPADAGFDFSITPTSRTVGIPDGGSATTVYTIVLTSGTLDGGATFNIVETLPSGVSATIPSLDHNHTELTFTIAQNASPQTFNFTVRGSSDGTTRDHDASLVLTNVPDFSVASLVSTQSVMQGTSSPVTVRIQSIAGFSSAVSLSAMGTALTNGVDASFSSPQVTPSANGAVDSVLTLTATANAGLGQGTVTVRGAAAGFPIHESTFSLAVTAQPAWRTFVVGSREANDPSAAFNCVGVGAIHVGESPPRTRVYAGSNVSDAGLQQGSNTLYEFTRLSDGGWARERIPVYMDAGGMGIAANGIHNVAFGPGRNDGVNRLYAAAFESGLWEIYRADGSWHTNRLPIASTLHPTSHTGFFLAAVGPGRNDGVNRVYAGYDQRLYECSYDAGSAAYGCGEIATTSSMVHGVVVGAGRNDGISRIYAANESGGVLEFSYGAGVFSGNTIYTPPMGVSAANISIGNVRSDTVTRIYAALRNGDVVELRNTTGGTFSSTTFSPVCGASAMGAIHADPGAVRDAGDNRLYVACGVGTVREVTPTSGSFAEIEIGRVVGGSLDAMGLTTYMYGLSVGPARNDGRARVYGGNFDGNIYEFSFE